MLERTFSFIITAIFCALFSVAALGQTTEFTYQGKLNDVSAPAVVLMNAVKEQQAQIEKQQALIDRQQRQIDQLRRMVVRRKRR